MKQTPETFWAKVDIRGDDECWLWTRYTDPNKYGHVGWHSKVYMAHRVAYSLANGGLDLSVPWVRGEFANFVLHSCDMPPCCNPKHLFLGTHQANMQDMTAKGRHDIRRGEDNSYAKLSNQQARDLRTRYAAGETNVAALSREYKVSRRCIQRVLDNVTFKELM